MQEEGMNPKLDFKTRLRRSQGRSGRTSSVNVKLTSVELALLQAAALKAQKAAGEWARDVLLRDARTTDSDPLFSEIVALRMMLNELLRPVCCGQLLSVDAFDAHLQNIRRTKQKVAQEIRRQYAAGADLES